MGEVGRTYFVYLLASRINGTFYVGVTNDLVRRIYEHREHVVEGFTKTYDVTRLVYYEMFGDISLAIAREKQLKRWRRAWKVQLIEKDNPRWNDLTTRCSSSCLTPDCHPGLDPGPIDVWIEWSVPWVPAFAGMTSG